MLDLKRPIYRQTAAYGHMGRTDIDLPWEKLDKVDALKEAVNACRTDIASKCGTVQPGKGRIAACLVAQKASVSKDCANAIEKVEKFKTE